VLNHRQHAQERDQGEEGETLDARAPGGSEERWSGHH